MTGDATPGMLFDVPTRLETTAQKQGNPKWVGINYERYLVRSGHIRQAFNKVQSDKVHIIDPAQILCQGGFYATEKMVKACIQTTATFRPTVCK